MKQLYNQYPTFNAGDVLTAEALSNLADYSDEQARLSRANLMGNGIVCGLEYECDRSKGEMRLRQGTAVTPSGRFIQIDREMTFPLYRKDGKVSFEKGDVSLKAADLANSIFALRYDLVEDKVVVCNQRSCDVNRSNSTISVTPAVLPSDTIARTTRLTGIGHHVALRRFAGISASHNLMTLKFLMLATFKDNQDAILEALKAVRSAFKGKDSLALENNLAYLDKNDTAWKARLNHLDAAIDRIDALDGKASRTGRQFVPQYYLGFLEDMELAVNEFIDFYNLFSKKYLRLRRPVGSQDESYDEDMIVLGKGDHSVDTDCYRDYFVPSVESNDFRMDKDVLMRLFERMCLMPQLFLSNPKELKGGVKIVPVEMNAPLGERVVPFYYRVEERLRKNWNPRGDASTKVVFFKEYNQVSVKTGLKPGVVFELQGYYGYALGKRDGLAPQIKSAFIEYGVPVEFKVVELKRRTIRARTVVYTEQSGKVTKEKALKRNNPADDFKSFFLEKEFSTKNLAAKPAQDITRLFGPMRASRKFADLLKHIPTDSASISELEEGWQLLADANPSILLSVVKNLDAATQKRVFGAKLQEQFLNAAKADWPMTQPTVYVLTMVRDYVLSAYDPTDRFSGAGGAERGQTIVVGCYRGRAIMAYTRPFIDNK